MLTPPVIGWTDDSQGAAVRKGKGTRRRKSIDRDSVREENPLLGFFFVPSSIWFSA
jgi:hypothetical protein